MELAAAAAVAESLAAASKLVAAVKVVAVEAAKMAFAHAAMPIE